MSSSLATQIESIVAPRQGVVLDDRRLPLFKLDRRLRDGEHVCSWKATVVDNELLEQGAPGEVMLQAIALPPGLPPMQVARALEPTLIDHPRIQLVHSAALPSAVLTAIQPDEPSGLLPPLHQLPVADDVPVVLLVKEWLEAVPLLTWWKNQGEALPLSGILDLLDTAAEALAALHRRGFAHGSVMPESLGMQELVNPIIPGSEPEKVWVPKLFDLGLTRTLAPPGSWPSGPAALWCAPEAFDPDGTVDWRRVDQLALAAILYALWTDHLPFESLPADPTPTDARQARRRQIEALPPPRGNPRARRLGVTPAMSAACMRAMAADPAERFPSVDAFSQTLRRATRENARQVASGVDTGPGTQPGTYVGALFRSRSTAAEPSSAGAAPLPALAQRPERPAPLGARQAELPAVIVEGAAPMARADEPAPAPLAPTPPAPAAVSRSPASVEERRRTKILTSPGADTGDTPLHPDEEERRQAERVTSLPALPVSPWAFNRLATLLFFVWLATLALLFWQSLGDSPLPPDPTVVQMHRASERVPSTRTTSAP